MSILRFLQIAALAFLCAMITNLMMIYWESILDDSPQKNCDVNNKTSLQVKPNGYVERNSTTSSKIGITPIDIQRLFLVPDFMKYTMGITQAEYASRIITFCIPKMICESSAADSGDLEQNSVLKELGNKFLTEFDAVSYHLASMIGRLFQNVDGVGCHNLYPNCPLSQKQLLRFAESMQPEEE